MSDHSNEYFEKSGRYPSTLTDKDRMAVAGFIGVSASYWEVLFSPIGVLGADKWQKGRTPEQNTKAIVTTLKAIEELAHNLVATFEGKEQG